jgi:hypothetical protein
MGWPQVQAAPPTRSLLVVALLVSFSPARLLADTDYAKAGPSVYADLVAAAKKYHVFAPQADANLGHAWADHLPRLEKEFAAVSSKEQLMRAVFHFANSLHNMHCFYNTPRPPDMLSTGVEMDVEWREDGPTFYVGRVKDAALAKLVSAGDLLVSLNGVPAKALVKELDLESSGNNTRNVAADIAKFLGSRDAQTGGVKESDAAEYVFASRADGKQVAVRATWQRPPSSRGGSEFEMSYQRNRCDEVPGSAYGPYDVSLLGANLCVYTSSTPPYDAYPVVRQFSFSYTGMFSFNGLKVEHDNLKKYLASLPKMKGVILDVRQNGGGNNPNWFLDWWAPASYADHFTYVRLVDELADPQALRRASITGWQRDTEELYRQALKARQDKQEFWGPRPFFCPSADCAGFDNIYTPKNQVTKAPVALVIGPRCVSACDHVAQVFKDYGFGPLVGVATSGGFTGFRLEHRVSAPGLTDDLGFVSFALSYEVSGKSKRNVEAVPVAPDIAVEPTFANRDNYDKLVVEAAIKALGSK